MISHQQKISILIPFRNAEIYIQNCFDSILAQSETNWEIIAVNDHSTDQSLDKVVRYATMDPRIKVVENKGAGIIDGLRTAYKASLGNLITRMDADDIMARQKLSALKQILVKNKKGIIATGLVKYFSDTKLGKGYKKYESWLNQIHINNHAYKEIYKECVIPSPCWMIWRKDLDLAGAFDSDIYPEDYDLCFRFYLNGIKIIPTKQVIHYWRDYPKRTSRNDPRLKDQSFMALKLDYFLKLECVTKNHLVIWGAGRKGKCLAKLLIQKKTPFRWICNNRQKQGHAINQIKIESPDILHKENSFKIVVAVSKRGAQNEITDYLEQKSFVRNEDYYFFC